MKINVSEMQILGLSKIHYSSLEHELDHWCPDHGTSSLEPKVLQCNVNVSEYLLSVIVSSPSKQIYPQRGCDIQFNHLD